MISLYVAKTAIKSTHGKVIASREAKLDALHPRWFREEVRKRNKGGFFLYCRGNGRSNYAKFENREWVAGEAIKLLTDEEATEWMKKYDKKAYKALETAPKKRLRKNSQPKSAKSSRATKKD